MNPSGLECRSCSNPARAALMACSAAGPKVTSSPSAATRRNASSVKSSRVSRTTVMHPPSRAEAGQAAQRPPSRVSLTGPAWHPPPVLAGRLEAGREHDTRVGPRAGEADRVAAAVGSHPDREPGGVRLDHLAATDHDADVPG